MKKKVLGLLLPLAVSCITGCGEKKVTVSIASETKEGPIAFAMEELKTAFDRNNITLVESGADYEISFAAIDSTLGEQAYDVKVDGTKITITGGDETGAMYGGLQVAENINLDDGIENVQNASGKPYIQHRGVRTRLVTDLRTPCYINNGNSAWANVENSWDINYWNDFFALLARKRYNLVNFATVNAFASMIRVPGYEACALEDVWKYTGEYDDNYYGNVTNIYQPHHSQPGNYEVIKKMTMDQKIEHWKAVFKSAHDHGIKVQYGMMNIYAFAEMAFAPQYGITVDTRENQVTKDYLSKGMETLLKTYKDIDYVSVGEGENMDYPSDTINQTHQWIYDVYGTACERALKGDPRENSFILYGAGSTPGSYIEELWKDFPYQRGVSPRYSDVHMYAITNGNQNDTIEAIDEHSSGINALAEGVKVLFNTRNEDAYHYTWGDPDFLRDYCRNMKHGRSNGFFLGTDGYYLGKEYEFKDESLNGQFYYDRHWVNYTLFGRFTYDPTITNEYVEKMVVDHYEDEADKEVILKAYETMKAGSQMLIQVQCQFTLRGTDAAWYPGNCQSHPTMGGYVGVRKLVNSDNVFVGAEDRYISFANYAKALLKGETPTQQNPYQTAEKLAEINTKVTNLVNEYNALSGKKSSATNEIIKDQVIVAALAKYYSHKFNGGMNLRRYNDTKDTSFQTKSVEDHQKALEAWKEYAKLFTDRFIIERLPRVGVVDPNAYTASVEKDISIVSKWTPREYK